MGLLREILNGEKVSYNVLKWEIFEFFKKGIFCPKKFQQDRRPAAHLQIRNFLSNTFVLHKISNITRQQLLNQILKQFFTIIKILNS